MAVCLRHRLEEEDYRGERYANHHKELKGNNDLLVITKPEVLMSTTSVLQALCTSMLYPRTLRRGLYLHEPVLRRR